MIELRRRAIVANGSLVLSPASLEIDAALDARDMRRRRSAREDVGDPCDDVSRRDGELARSLSAEDFFLTAFGAAASASASEPPPMPNMSSKDPDAGLAPPPGGDDAFAVVLFVSLNTSSNGLKEAMASQGRRGGAARGFAASTRSKVRVYLFWTKMAGVYCGPVRDAGLLWS